MSIFTSHFVTEKLGRTTFACVVKEPAVSGARSNGREAGTLIPRLGIAIVLMLLTKSTDNVIILL